MLVTKDTAALHWLLAVLSLLFLCSWFFMLVVFYALRADVVHTIPWAVLGALLFCGLVYGAHAPPLQPKTRPTPPNRRPHT